MADASTTPEWWEKKSDEDKEMYLRVHPRSKMHKVASAKLKERLSKNPKERTKLRSILKTIAKSPARLLSKDIDKVANAPDKLSKKQKQKVEDQAKDALKSKSPKKMLKAIVTGLAVAGVLTIGGAAMASGGLPYAIIGTRLFGDGKQAIQEIYQRVKGGEDTVKAVFTTIGNTFERSARDPKMLAAALILSQKRDNDADGKSQKKTDSKKTEKKQPKRQGSPKKSDTKGKA